MTHRLLSVNLSESDSDDNDFDPANEEQMADDSGSENEEEMPENNDDSEHDEPMAGESSSNRPSTSGNSRRELNDYMRGKPFMPIKKVHRYLENTYSERVSRKAIAALIGVIQYLTSHLLMEAEAKMRSEKQRRITERIISMAIQENKELSRLLTKVNIPKSGVYGIIGHQPEPITRRPRRSQSD